MAARAPPDDTADPDVIEFGIAALAARLDESGVAYPTTSQQLCATVNNTAIPIDGAGNTVELAEALDRLPQDEFATQGELLDMLHPVFEEQRKQAAKSVLGRLRALLPV
jgi:hypothetical protein